MVQEVIQLLGAVLKLSHVGVSQVLHLREVTLVLPNGALSMHGVVGQLLWDAGRSECSIAAGFGLKGALFSCFLELDLVWILVLPSYSGHVGLHGSISECLALTNSQIG